MITRTRVLPAIALLAVVTGCSRANSPRTLAKTDLERAGDLNSSVSGPTSDGQDASLHSAMTPFFVHDFGTFLDTPRKVDYSFRLENPSELPIGIVKAISLTPCCCALGPLPTTIPPGSSAEVPVSLKLGPQSGPKRGEALVKTDSREHPIWAIELRANVLAKHEIGPLETSTDHRVSLGRTGHWIWRVLPRYASAETPFFPEAVKATNPLVVSFVGPSSAPVLSQGFWQSTRDVEILVPATTVPGTGRSELAVGFADGTSIQRIISWDVVAPIRATPPGFVVDAAGGPVTRSVVLESNDGPFQVTGINNPFAVNSSLSQTIRPLRTQSIELEIDPSRALGRPVESIRITTGHPNQPEVVVSVIVLDKTSGGAR